ncbi:MAG: endonuclease/exonuclease/phosphatase family protein [Candidatus Kariarchaeaceae archaeon]|jgi:endonuclease/exonuclease/phosphatase family metal-dependent hydrolase
MSKIEKIYLLILMTIILFSFAGLLSDLIFFSPEEKSGDPITVMTYNLHGYYQYDPKSISEIQGNYIFNHVIDVIQDVNPDILGLQESEGNRISYGNQNGVEWLANKLDMYYYYGPKTADQIYGVSLLSRWPIISQNAVILTSNQYLERAAITATIDSPVGELNVIVTHVQTPSNKDDQFAQVNEIASLAENLDDAIIIGDFNIEPDPQDRSYIVLNDTFVDSWVEAGNRPNDSIGFTAPVKNPEKRIDYVWLSKNDWDVITGSAKITGNSKASDHLAYFVEIRLR